MQTQPEPGSFVRALSGVLSLVVALVVIAFGFAQMIGGLQGAGYGSSEVWSALAILAAGGGFMALGVALLIWEMSIRYGIRK